jgi:hypothetical protein
VKSQPSSGPVVVDVLTTSGEPVPSARVALASAPAPVPDVAALSDARGRCVLATVGPGAYTIVAHADGFEPAEATVIVGPGQARAELRLERSGD